MSRQGFQSWGVPNTNMATIMGAIALVLWSVGAYLLCVLADLPPFEVIALSQLMGGVTCLLCRREKLSHIRRSFAPKSALLTLFFVINQVAYPLAFRMAPPVQVDLINYIWPTLMVIGCAMARGQRLSLTQVLGMVLSFSAIVALLVPQLFSESFSPGHIGGYLMAGTAALSWTAYCVIKNSDSDVVASNVAGLLITASLSAVLNTFFGEWRALTLNQFALITLLGACVYGSAYPMWVKGIASGDYRLLGSLANGLPVLSIAWLVVGGLAPLSMALVIASILITAGCSLVGVKSNESALIDEEKECALAA